MVKRSQAGDVDSLSQQTFIVHLLRAGHWAKHKGHGGEKTQLSHQETCYTVLVSPPVDVAWDALGTWRIVI